MNKIKKILIRLNLIKSNFDGQLFIYLDKNNKPTNEITDRIKWLENINVYCYYNRQNIELFNEANKLHPELKGKMFIF